MNIKNETTILNQLFNVGFAIFDYDYTLPSQMLSSTNFHVDVIEPQTEMYFGPKEALFAEFMPLIQTMSYIFGNDPQVDANISRGQQDNTFSYHTDFHDGRSDFFILFYPKEWNFEDGGSLDLGVRNLLMSTVDHCCTYEPSVHQIVLINNLNPLFVHKVQPISKNNMERYCGCIEIKRGTYGSNNQAS